MSPSIINVLVSSFDGLGLPPTLSLPLVPSTSVSELFSALDGRLPGTTSRLTLTTLSNKQLQPQSARPISDFLDGSVDDFLSLRLTAPLCGGKGGFGSQLRAAGGRMSSKRKKNQGEDNGSSRNLDGRRIRTVNEAKALAEYLAIKPDMERKEKERRRQRWQQIVEAAEKKQEEIKYGKRGQLNGKWVEDKEETGERTRDAVLAAMKAGTYSDNLLSSSAGSSSADSGGASSEGEQQGRSATQSKETTPISEPEQSEEPKGSVKARTFFGFDDDEDFLSSDSEDETEDKR
ncbi:hypothetical protein VTK73DRAFT_4789 [Phialemonium thermophilum]|uniref:Sde2 N-terminal ubiquitin domain-containing protein n=1 Tax=Phialemonium thermophilum TaxID=223376 RepID=A0ABR3Y007_9PEZI